MVFRCIFEKVEHLGILGGPTGVGRKEAFVGEDKVVGGHGFSVGPFRCGIEIEGPFREFWIGCPSQGCPREGGAILAGIFDTEALEECTDDVGFEDSGNEVRVEPFGFIAVPDDQNTGFVGLRDVRLRFTGNEDKGES